ncbi:MAG: hypothetical protein GX763_00260 [Clostridiaceae bacterium]|nr:hypothetical protein [Clostridiaceae bacterium]
MDDQVSNQYKHKRSQRPDSARDLNESDFENTFIQSRTAQLQTQRARKYRNADLNNTESMNTDLLTRGLEDRYSPETEKKLGHRVYRLKGYTTVDKVNRMYQQQKYQRTLRNILTTIMIAIALIIIFVLYNPFKDTEEWKKITGMDSILGEAETTETIPADGLPDILP